MDPVKAGSVPDLHLEVLPESETSFSVTFQRPDADSLAVCEHFRIYNKELFIFYLMFYDLYALGLPVLYELRDLDRKRVWLIVAFLFSSQCW